MGLREKTLTILLATIVAMTLAVTGALGAFYLRSQEAIDRAEAEEDARRLALLVQDDLAQLDTLCRDWAYWDDAYAFAKGEGPRFLESNLAKGETVGLLGLAVLAIRDEGGRTLFEYEDAPGRAPAVGAELARFGRLDPAHAGLGLVAAGQDLLLVAARPILKSDLSGPPRGSIAMARRIDAAWLERVERLLGRSVTIRAAPGRAEVGAVEIRREGNLVRATLALAGLARGAAALAEVSAPSASSRFGTTRFVTVLGVILIIIALSAIVAVFALEWLFLRRIRRIGAELDRMAEPGRRSARLPVEGGDELAALSAAMNASLDRLERLVAEREAMLREIHHRVRNNLQVIASMLTLQASSAEIPEVAAAILRSRLRVQAIAIALDDLLSRSSLDRIGTRGLLERLAASVTADREDGLASEIVVEGGDVEVDMDRALPLALAAGEALHNAQLHAFPPGTRGRISLGARLRKDGTLLLEVRDDGVGIPEGAARRLGLGFALVEALAIQLRGSFSAVRHPEGGTLFTLEAPLGD